MRRTLLESLDKRSHNFIFFMLKRYHYLVNPSCAMAAQGMKTKRGGRAGGIFALCCACLKKLSRS